MVGAEHVWRCHVVPVSQAERPGSAANDAGLRDADVQRKGPSIVAAGLVVLRERGRSVALPAVTQVERLEVPNARNV